MCKAVEDLINETVEEEKAETARHFIEEGTIPPETIAKCTGIPLEEIK